ncbi:hypothetical protein E1293_22955 [Actinomadura darangshiensis]|uniref:Uncharacterized protein n=1 Tax=Actinomadura darangshiensis TaxID=705336 RepID=A0A4R5B0U0_9ACTN|nr:hypothetical protein [Actinomadura darangshiensis]TDD79608.1 hypothetical protein E1293_22955 [Actinomadura darangshiensis]
MIVGSGRRRDAGASFFEYAALLGIVVGIGAVAFAGLPTAATDSVAASICKIFSISDCPWKPHPKEPPPEALPCNTEEMTTEHNNNVQILFYSRKEKKRSIVALRSNGEIWETTGTDTKNGFDVEAGIGFTLKGKGASIAGGVGMDWGAHAATTWKFKDAAQRDAFNQAVKEEGDRLIKTKGFSGVGELKEIPYKVADRMGIKYATYYGKSTTGFGKVDGSFSIVSGGGGIENGDEVGTTRNSDGTFIKTYKTNETYGINGSLGVIVAEAGAQKDWANGSAISVFYDKNGNPTKAIITTDTKSTWDAGVSLGKTWSPDRKKNGPPDQNGDPTDDGGPQGSKGGGPKWTPWKDGGGGQSTTQIHIPLTNDPGAQRVIDAMLNPSKVLYDKSYPGGMQGLTNDFGDLVTNKGTTYNMNYDRSYSKDGFDISGSYVVKLGGYENSTEQTQLKLKDAYIVDPVTGERKPWTGCRP